MKKHANNTISDKRIEELHVLLKRLKLELFPIDLKNEAVLKGLFWIDEALTHTSAQAGKNHERLEFLGDAVLRLAASEFIDRNFPKMDVGERSALRAQLVSDRWLSEMGRHIGIAEMMVLGPKAAKDDSAKKTLEAEATEALIGAIYQCFKSLEPIHQWLSPYWQETSEAVLADPHRQNSKSALQEWSQARFLTKPTYKTEERSKYHGDQRRFFSKVHVEEQISGEGWGGSRREAEKEAARNALLRVKELPDLNKDVAAS